MAAGGGCSQPRRLRVHVGSGATGAARGEWTSWPQGPAAGMGNAPQRDGRGGRRGSAHWERAAVTASSARGGQCEGTAPRPVAAPNAGPTRGCYRSGCGTRATDEADRGTSDRPRGQGRVGVLHTLTVNWWNTRRSLNNSIVYRPRDYWQDGSGSRPTMYWRYLRNPRTRRVIAESLERRRPFVGGRGGRRVGGHCPHSLPRRVVHACEGLDWPALLWPSPAQPWQSLPGRRWPPSQGPL